MNRVKIERPRTSPILIFGRIIFGILAILSFIMFMIERSKDLGGRPEIYVGTIVISAAIFGLTFVKRAF